MCCFTSSVLTKIFVKKKVTKASTYFKTKLLGISINIRNTGDSIPYSSSVLAIFDLANSGEKIKSNFWYERLNLFLWTKYTDVTQQKTNTKKTKLVYLIERAKRRIGLDVSYVLNYISQFMCCIKYKMPDWKT